MDRGSHSGAKISWADVDVTVSLVEHEVMTRLLLNGILHSLDTSGKTIKYLLDVASLLHGDDSKLILLIDPGQEGFVLVVKDSTTLWPVTFHASNLEVRIPRHEEKMIVHELLSNLLTHSGQGEVGSGKITLQVSKGLLHQVLHVDSLLLGDSGRQSESIDVPH